MTEKVKSEKTKRILTRVTDAASSAAKHVAQVYADDLRAASADGKLTDTEKQTARKQALTVMLQDLGHSAQSELYDWMQFSTAEQRDAFLTSHIESAVATLKQISPKAKDTSDAAPEEREVPNAAQN